MFQLLKKASLGSLLIAGIILASSLPAMAQTYKGKCRDSIEGDLDSCRVILENNNLYLKFKESELNQTIDLAKINNLRIANRQETDIWSMSGYKTTESFSISWNEGSNNYATNFSLKQEYARELLSFLETRVSDRTKSQIYAYYLASNEAAKESNELWEKFLEREHEKEVEEIKTRNRQNTIIAPYIPPLIIVD